ncbi:MAG: hypothetical protein RBU37_20635, partial [Myxococcota bacterium]|nr:hypothetical protein [Myxococcota bacterium]
APNRQELGRTGQAPNRQELGRTGQAPNRQELGRTGQAPNRQELGRTGQAPNRQEFEARRRRHAAKAARRVRARDGTQQGLEVATAVT